MTSMQMARKALYKKHVYVESSSLLPHNKLHNLADQTAISLSSQEEKSSRNISHFCKLKAQSTESNSTIQHQHRFHIATCSHKRLAQAIMKRLGDVATTNVQTDSENQRTRCQARTRRSRCSHQQIIANLVQICIFCSCLCICHQLKKKLF